MNEDTLSRSGKRAISCKWVYRLKHNANGTKRFKARLVIKGYEQHYGIDFEETFAPVAKFVTLRVLFALAAQFDWEIEQIDVVTAFLIPELHEEVYMDQPEGFTKSSASGGTLYCRLRKCLYGLKQAPYKWYMDIDNYLINFLGLTCSSEDHNLYISISANIILLLYIDDIQLFSPSKKAINSLKSKLMMKYRIVDLRPASQFLSLEILRNCQARMLYLHQSSYIEHILK